MSVDTLTATISPKWIAFEIIVHSQSCLIKLSDLDFTSLDENHCVMWSIGPLSALSEEETCWLTPWQFRQRGCVRNEKEPPNILEVDAYTDRCCWWGVKVFGTSESPASRPWWSRDPAAKKGNCRWGLWSDCGCWHPGEPASSPWSPVASHWLQVSGKRRKKKSRRKRAPTAPPK